MSRNIRQFPGPVRAHPRIRQPTNPRNNERVRQTRTTRTTWVKHHKKRNYTILALVTILLTITIIALASIPSTNIGQQAPDFTTTDINNNTFHLAAIDKPILLEFMRTGCSACATQAPILSQLYTVHGAHVQFVSISTDPATDQPNVLSAYATTHNSPWTWIRDTSDLSNIYGIRYTPTVYVIDRDQVIRSRFEGVASLQELDAACTAVM